MRKGKGRFAPPGGGFLTQVTKMAVRAVEDCLTEFPLSALEWISRVALFFAAYADEVRDR